MPLKQSEAIVLRSYPLREADLLVAFFTRAEGKVRGVARAAKKSKRRFGGALEPLTYVRVWYEDRERQELARVDSCEVLEQVLPEREASDAVFRLALSVLGHLRAGAIWMPLTYFDLWIVRLTGLLPELGACIACGAALNGSRAYFHPLADGLMCAADKRLASSEMSKESRALAAEMFRAPIEQFAGAPWPRERAAELRRFLAQRIERHLEKKLVTGAMLEKLD